MYISFSTAKLEEESEGKFCCLKGQGEIIKSQLNGVVEVVRLLRRSTNISAAAKTATLDFHVPFSYFSRTGFTNQQTDWFPTVPDGES